MDVLESLYIMFDSLCSCKQGHSYGRGGSTGGAKSPPVIHPKTFTQI